MKRLTGSGMPIETVVQAQGLDVAIDVLFFLLGGLLLWFGLEISGHGALYGAWCQIKGSDFGTSWTQWLWLARQHCGYCYVGAAAILTAVVRPLLRLPRPL